MQPLIIGTLETFMICKRMAVRMKSKARRLAERKRYRHYFVFNDMLHREMMFAKTMRVMLGPVREQLLEQSLITRNEDQELFGTLQPIVEATENLIDELYQLKERWRPKESLVAPSFKDHLTNCREAYRGYRPRENLREVMERLSGRPQWSTIESNFQQQLAAELMKLRGAPKPELLKCSEHLASAEAHFSSYLVFLREYQSKLPEDHPERYELFGLAEDYLKLVKELDRR